MIGISTGAITIKVLNEGQKDSLIGFLNSFFKILDQDAISSLTLLKQSLLNNIQTIALMWFLGIIVIGLPIVLLILILRGFVIGFTVGFLIEQLGIKGFLFSALAVFPQNIFIIPGLIIISVISMKFSLTMLKNKIKKKVTYNYLNIVLQYTLTILMITVLLCIGSFFEAYITPIFMKLTSGYIT